MGYITKNNSSLSGTTCTKPLFVCWTKLGREYLVGKKAGRKLGISVKYFCLGDSDINYYVNNSSIEGFVPNISGVEDSCLNGTLNENILFKVNVDKQGLLLVKDFTIIIPKNNNSTVGCPSSALIYDVFVNSSSIFTTRPDYFTLLPTNLFNSITDINIYAQNNIKSLIIGSLYYNITVNYSYVLINNLYQITGVTFLLNDFDFQTVVTDNSSSICNNVIQSLITFNQKTIVNQGFIDSVNMGSFTLPDCN